MILFVSSWYPSRVNETLGNFVQKHAEAASLFEDVVVLHVCFDEKMKGKPTTIKISKDEPLKSVIIYVDKFSNPWKRFREYLSNYRYGLHLVTHLYGAPDLIHVNVVFPVGLLFVFLKAYRKIPYVITEHWAGYLPEYPAKLSFWKKLLLRKVFKRSAAVLPVSDDLREALQGLGFKGNYTVVPNVVDTKVFHLGPKAPKDVVNILHVSSLDNNQKNMSGILRVMRRLHALRQDFVLHVVSDGNQKPFVDHARGLGLDAGAVKFHGGKSTKEVAAMMMKSDFLLLFSNYENLPCVILEGFACGLPVVATDVGGISEHVNQQQGRLVKATDEQALFDAVLFMIDHYQDFDREMLHAYAEEHFSYAQVGKQISEVYRGVLGRKA